VGVGSCKSCILGTRKAVCAKSTIAGLPSLLKASERLCLGKRSVRVKRTRRRRNPDATASLLAMIVALTHEVRVLGAYVRRMGAILKARQPSIAIQPYVRDELEADIVKAFLAKTTRTTTALATELGTYPKKVLRAIRRLNRRASKREGVDIFHFDPATRTWQLQLEIVDQKELR